MTVDGHLVERVSELLAEYLDDGETAPEPLTGPVAISCGTALVLVRLVDSDPPLLRVFSPMLRGVERSPELLTELNEINAHYNFVRVFWRGSNVYAATETLAASIDATALEQACDAVSDVADYYDERLQSRFGGEIAYRSTEA